jgi:AraC-like DNA-binding protein
MSRSGGAGLERSCRRPGASWIASTGPVEGVELLRAWLRDEAYERHRHDTYAVGVTDAGVQVFDYRGATRASRRGRVVVLYPDEVHDGRAGTSEGFGYRIVYVAPARLAEAVRAVRGRSAALPFLRDPVARHPQLARAIDQAFAAPLDALAADGLTVALAEGLVAGEGAPTSIGRRVDTVAVERARQFLDAERGRLVRASELESITGLGRYDLCRQFRIALGTSPHRYLLLRRLDDARARLGAPRARAFPGKLAEIATEVGFADQAHFTRAFRAAFGVTPGCYRSLSRGAPALPGRPEPPWGVGGAMSGPPNQTTSSVRAVVSPKRPSANVGKPA